MPDDFPIELTPPDLAPYQAGNAGLPYVMRFAGGAPGPAVVIAALVHGNELCGAVALDRLIRADIRPARGTLTLAFCNVAAYGSFDANDPGAARYLDEDFNRVWDKDILECLRSSAELKRARELRPVFDAADYLLDLHSMLLGGSPLILAGMLDKSLALARKLGAPALIVRDQGHQAGPRLRDYADFADQSSPRTALLVECGQHWEKAAAEMAFAASLRFLAACGVLDFTLAPAPAQRIITVTDAVTVASEAFHFLGDYRGLEVISKAGTPIARDGARVVATPYDDCVLVMPSRRLSPGQTAVRLGRYAG